jgi:hypothetical protein
MTTPKQYLARLERLDLNGEYRAALDYAEAHRAIELTSAQSIRAGMILTHAMVQLHWAEAHGGAASPEMDAGAGIVPAPNAEMPARGAPGSGEKAGCLI